VREGVINAEVHQQQISGIFKIDISATLRQSPLIGKKSLLKNCRLFTADRPWQKSKGRRCAVIRRKNG